MLKQSYEYTHGFEYDLVYKIRPDIALNAPIPNVANLGDKDVMIAARKHDGSPGLKAFKACDILNVAKSQTMDRVCGVVDNFEQFYVKNVVDGKLRHSGFVDYLHHLGLNISVFSGYNWNSEWVIVRG